MNQTPSFSQLMNWMNYNKSNPNAEMFNRTQNGIIYVAGASTISMKDLKTLGANLVTHPGEIEQTDMKYVSGTNEIYQQVLQQRIALELNPTQKAR